MILSDDDLNSRLDSPANLINKVQVKKPTPNDRGSDIPDVVRELIAITACSSKETQSRLAETFEVSQPIVSQIKRGLVDSRQDERLTEIVRSKTEQLEQSAHEAALDNLVTALQLVSPHLINETSAKGLARIAKDMSGIVKDLRKDDKDSSATASRVIINMVNMKKESNFETIDV